MQFCRPRGSIVLVLAAICGTQEQPVVGATVADVPDRPAKGSRIRAPPSLSSYQKTPTTGNPIPMELIGSWKGSICGWDDPEPRIAKLELTESNGVIAGWHCIDVGKGYWWGEIPYTNEVWCNLFQVEQVHSNNATDATNIIANNNTTLLVSYRNLLLADGACPTSLSTLELSTKPLQSSFTKQTNDHFSSTCNLPAGSNGDLQPSYNSRFPSGVVLPNPFAAADPVPKPRSSATSAAAAATNYELPVMSETTCRIQTDDTVVFQPASAKPTPLVVESAATTRFGIYSLVIANAVTSFFVLGTLL